ncbi:MAG: conjugal transfer protein TraX [Ruminococcus sp.]|nr:conjugal transfer protein TraX [Ruminococcus sp.]
MKTKKSGITASDLKYLAILAMLIDHIAYLFVTPFSPLYCIMRFIGRTTAPLMCFFISEGYHYTRNLKKYFQRMGVFAVISHFTFAFCFDSDKSSMITTLFLSLFAVHVVNTDKIKKEFTLPIILFICTVAERCDWGSEAVIYTLAFELARNNRKNQLIAYGLTASIFKICPLIVMVINDISCFSSYWYRLGILLPIPLLLLYNGEKGGGKYTKWVFYVFYPAHLLLLGVIHNVIS